LIFFGFRKIKLENFSSPGYHFYRFAENFTTETALVLTAGGEPDAREAAPENAIVLEARLNSDG
jgi:hypothetical protein